MAVQEIFGRGWEFLRCGDVRDRLGNEYGPIGRLLCWAFWLHGPDWIVPGSGGIGYGVPHGEYGLMLWPMKKLVGDMERHFGINAGITSGYRCPIGNEAEGGEDGSQHTSGTAYDFVVPGWTDDQKQEIVDWVIDQGSGKYAEHYPDNRKKPHIHMQLLTQQPLLRLGVRPGDRTMRTTTLLAATALGWCLAAHVAAAQEPDQAAIALELRSGDGGRIGKALARLEPNHPFFFARYPEGFEPTAELVEALVAAYEREVALGKPNGELSISILTHIIATKHPLTIDVLTRSLTGSYPAVEALLNFGPSVIPGIVDLATSSEATPDQAEGAMFALREAVAWWGPELGPGNLEAIRAAAVLHLEGAPDFIRGPPSTYRQGTLFDHAAVIAAALQDPGLSAVARDARHPSTGEPGIPDRVREKALSWERALQRAEDRTRPPPRR